MLLLAACAAPPPLPIDATDPHEAANRRVHSFNQSVDRNLLAPITGGGGGVLAGPVGEGLGNVAGNLSMPSAILNKVLQGRLADAVHNSWRFAINSTIGVAGVFDPASAIGLEPRLSDFGATLHRWGAGEGAYQMLPVLGPSTERDTLGMVVDVVIDPLGLISKPDEYWARGLRLGTKLSDRARFGGSVDSILHESADSYGQLRLMYLQSRRHELGQEAADDAFIDPYDE